ncbi:MAG: DUF92 domain-containing protein [Balneolaceae bacterium]
MQITLLHNADRILNYLFGFCLVLLFVLEANYEDHMRMLIALGLSLLAAILAFLLNWLTLDGMRASVLFGTAVLGTGGWMPALAVVLFFFSSSLLSRRRGDEGDIPEVLISSRTKFRRDGWQVWANGFWIVLMLIFFFLIDKELLLIAAYAAVAAATSDTWATEIGCRNPGKTVLITSFKKTTPGTDGGISIKGSLAGIAGAVFIAVALYFFSPRINEVYAAIIAISGFSGCIVDSILGAKYQHTEMNGIKEEDSLEPLSSEYKNCIINWAATGTGAIAAMILTQIMMYEMV